MKRSTQVPATLIIALAASMSTSGCSSRECRDSTGRLLPDSACPGGVGYGHYGGAHWVSTGGFGSSGGSGAGG